MPVSKKRKKIATGRAVESRHKKMLYLPMPRAEADQISLQVRVAFEAVRQGRADHVATRSIATVILLTEFLTEAGHGTIPLSTLREAGRGVFDVLNGGADTGEWRFPESLIATLTEIVNEYDRLVRETRLEAIMKASERLDALIAANNRIA